MGSPLTSKGVARRSGGGTAVVVASPPPAHRGSPPIEADTFGALSKRGFSLRCGSLAFAQSRPNPRGSSMLSSSASSSSQIASSFWAIVDSWRLSGRWSSHA